MFERIATGLVCGMSLLACASVAQAQTSFPNRPITMVVPLPAGGTADLLLFRRGKASSLLGQQVVIENRAGGAGGRVGTESVLRSPPDGYTILCAPQLTYSITHLVFTKRHLTRAMEPSACLRPIP
jgi:tripartite-type tricarboxylate transporter receptor subunit TctC